MKRILVLMLLLAALLCGCGGAKETEEVPFSGGTGTQEDPYRIATAEDLWEMARRMEGGEGKVYASACYILTGDIDLEKKSWTPMGSDQVPFTGVLDGDGHTIRGLMIQGSSISLGEKEKHYGLMYTLQGTVRNLTISDSRIQVKQEGSWTGAFAGDAFHATFENCHTTATVQITGTYQTAGICANVSRGSVIRGCTNGADITATESAGSGAGIVCYTGSAVTECKNTGTVTSSGDAAGIAVSANDGLADCENTGNVSAGGYAAGIACRFGDGALNGGMNEESVALLRCSNSGSVTSEKKPAAGVVVSCRTGRVEGCTNSGEVTSPMETGGIVGYFQQSVFGDPCVEFTVADCENTGTVQSLENYAAGGICGMIYGGSTRICVTGCTNQGTVSAAGRKDVAAGGAEAGGIVGEAMVTQLTVSGCGNSGRVTGCGSAGGIVGRIQPETDTLAGDTAFLAKDCVNSGRIYVMDPGGLYLQISVGGILGFCRFETEDPELLPLFGSVSFENCRSTGPLGGDRGRAEYLQDDLWGNNPGGVAP